MGKKKLASSSNYDQDEKFKKFPSFQLPFNNNNMNNNNNREGKKKSFLSNLKGKMDLNKYKENLMATAAGKIIAGAASGIGSMLLFAAVFKVVSAKTAETSDAKKEANKLDIERKARLADVRRQLAGPLRASAIELHERLEDILCTPPRRKSQLERVPQPVNFFALHFPDDPSDCVNSTLFRICAYLEKVLQFNHGVHVEGVSEEDTWQYLLDKKLASIQRAMASSIPRFDAVLKGERLTEVIAVMVSRAMVQYDDDGTAGASKFVDSLVGEKEAEDLADAVARYRKRTAAIHRTDSLGRSQQLFPEFEPATNLKERDFSASHFEFSREYRWPMRFFEDHQIAMAEIFASIRPKSEQTQTIGGRPQKEIEYIAFVAKIEDALALESENPPGLMRSNPWVHWMLPARSEIARYASLQAQNFKLLRRREMRELTAARARLVQLSKALQDLIDMLYMRFDHPAFKVKSRDDKFKHLKRLEMKKRQQEKFNRQASARAQKYWKIIEEYVPVIARNHSLEGIDRKGERQPWKFQIPFRKDSYEIPTRTGWEIVVASVGVGFAILLPPLLLQSVANKAVKSPRIPLSEWLQKTPKELMIAAKKSSSSASINNSGRKKQQSVPKPKVMVEEEITYVIAKDDGERGEFSSGLPPASLS